MNTDTPARIAIRGQVASFAAAVARMDIHALRIQRHALKEVCASFSDTLEEKHGLRLLAIVDAVQAAKFPDQEQE